MSETKYQPKPGSGTLFDNTRKQTENHPDLTGSILLPDGKEYWLSAWKKQGRNGEFLSVSIGKEKLPKGSAPAKADNKDDVPF